MSAFVCNPEHYGLLAAFAVTHGLVTPPWLEASREATATKAAERLAFDCIRSVAARYPGDVSGSRPGVAMEDHDIITQAGAWARFYLVDWPKDATPARMVHFARCYAYQTCETADWDQRDSYRQIDAIIHRAQVMVMDGAPAIPAGEYVWEWEDPTFPPVQPVAGVLNVSL